MQHDAREGDANRRTVRVLLGMNMSDLKQQIEKRLKELRDDCALQRIHVRNAFGPRWSGCKRANPDKPSSWDLHWENLQAEAQMQRPKDVRDFAHSIFSLLFLAEHVTNRLKRNLNSC